jgi:hypothetical protein
MPACERIDAVIAQKPPSTGLNAHDLMALFCDVKETVFELANLLNKTELSDVSQIPALLTDRENAYNQGNGLAHKNRDRLILERVNRQLVIEALGDALGIRNQFTTHYRQHSPLFTHPTNIALLAQKTPLRA